MEVNMPGCRWLTVPGNGTPEREIFNFLLRSWDSGPGSYLAKVWGVSTDYQLMSLIISSNHSRKGGLYGLIFNDELRIGDHNNFDMLAGGMKPTNGTVVVRQVGRRWEVLAHFTDPKTTKIIIEELQKHSPIMLRTVEKLKGNLEKLPSPAHASLTATMEVLLAALKLAAVAEDKETTA